MKQQIIIKATQIKGMHAQLVVYLTQTTGSENLIDGTYSLWLEYVWHAQLENTLDNYNYYYTNHLGFALVVYYTINRE